MILNFHGGAQINAKRLFAESEIKNIDSCSAVCIRAGEDADISAPVGADVLRGTLIGFSDGTPVYASVAGRFNGLLELEGENYFVIMNSGEDGEEMIYAPETRALTDMTREDIIAAAKQYAIIDPRVGRPLWELLSEAENCRRLVIDCTEPFAHSAINYRLCIERPRELVGGSKVVLHAIGALKCVFAIEHSKKSVVSSLSQYAKDDRLFAIAALEEKYPYGDRALMYGIYIKTLENNETTVDKGVLIISAEAAIALYSAMVSGMPQTYRYITICGDGMENGGNFRVPRGITMHDMAELCGGFNAEKLLIENTLLSGKPIGGVVNDNTVAIIASETKIKNRTDCISCGKCAHACPVKLFPSEILLGKNRHLKKKCIYCGACEYICPSGIPLLELIQSEEVTNNDK